MVRLWTAKETVPGRPLFFSPDSFAPCDNAFIHCMNGDPVQAKQSCITLERITGLLVNALAAD
ncbi:MAG: hypothetical protein LBF65_01435 [Holosporales bacterium]|nr:hypothetical protein [Holosporales bacterium]